MEKGCTMDSVDNIDRLVEIEHQAADIIAEAEKKASATLLEAKSASESTQNEKLVEARKTHEAEHAAFLKSIDAQGDQEIRDYRANLKSIALHPDALAMKVQGFIHSGD